MRGIILRSCRLKRSKREGVLATTMTLLPLDGSPTFTLFEYLLEVLIFTFNHPINARTDFSCFPQLPHDPLPTCK